MTAGIVIISVNTGAYMSEIIRSGIQSVERGQVEAARSIGMNSEQTMIYIVLPQAIRIHSHRSVMSLLLILKIAQC